MLDAGCPPELFGRSARELVAPLSAHLRIPRREAAGLARSLAGVDPLQVRADAAEAGIGIVTWEKCTYPDPLRDLADPPPAIFIRGDVLASDSMAVAIVGSRRASPYGLRVARTLAEDLARAGVTIVSGLARGIDGAAHAGTLAAGGRTWAVLGSGLLEPYPPEHADLLEDVARHGAAFSEFPLHAPPAPQNFPRRNRIIAALSLGVVVVEAAERSGALNTVRHALDLGRSVMAVPGPVDQAVSRGTLTMLRDGAAPVGSAADVFSALGWCNLAKSDLPAGERAVLDLVRDTGATAADVAATLDIEEDRAANRLVALELRGLLEREPGGGAYRAS